MALTSADLDNGKLDLQTIEDVVNSASTSPVVSRLGNSINTLSAASAAIQANVDAVDAAAAQEIATVTAAGDQAVSDIQSESTQASDAITTARTDAVASINADVATVDVAKSSAITQFQENAREVGYNEVVAWSSGVLYNDFRVLVTNGGLTYKLRIEHTSSGVFATDLAAGRWLVYQPTALGTAAVRDAATSGTPTTGLVDAALGFYGVGVGTIAAAITDTMSNDLRSGIHNFQGGTTTNLPSGALYGNIICTRRRNSAGVDEQRTLILSDYPSGRLWFRIAQTGSSTNDSGWQEIYHTGNAVGSVASGAIIETGTNANGTYTKFADGTMISISTVALTGGTTVAVGAIFRSTSVLAVTFPATFIAAPHCYATPNTAQIRWTAPSAAGATTVNYSFLVVSALNNADNDTVRVTAIGRWKA